MVRNIRCAHERRDCWQRRCLAALRPILIVLLLVAGCGMGAAHANQLLDLDHARDLVHLDHGEMSWLRDDAGSMTLDDVTRSSSRFAPIETNFTQGFTTATFWLRLPVHTASSMSAWWLDIRPPALDDVTLYVVGPGGIIATRHTGALQPLSSRDGGIGSFLLQLNFPKGDSIVYLRLHSSSSLAIQASLQRIGSYPVAAVRINLRAGVYLGLLLAIMLVSCVYVTIWRRRLYVIYLGYIACQLGIALSTYGIFAWLLPDLPVLAARIGPVCFGLAIALGMTFFVRLLEFDASSARVKVLIVAAIMGGASALAGALGLFGHLALPLMLAVVAALLAAFSMSVQRLRRQGNAIDRVLVGSFVFFLVFITEMLLRGTGILHLTDTTQITGRVGNSLHLLLLQLAVMLRSRASEREVIRAREEAEQRLRTSLEQEQFLAMITHEIRTPLSVITAARESLHFTDDNNQQPDRAQRYERIRQAVRRIDLLLNLAVHRERIDELGSDQPAQVDIVELTQELLESVTPEHRNRFVVRSSHNNLMLFTNRALLQSSLFNLVDNACKYAPAPAGIQIDIQRQGENTVNWSICDQGPGVPAGDHSRIFEKYYRSAENTGIPGLGLGLFVSRQMIARLGGRLSLHELEGKGAMFEVVLPLINRRS